MVHFATVYSNFTSHGKEDLGFYDNTEKIEGWRKKYKIPYDTEDLLHTLNHSGRAATYILSRAYYIAYVLASEGYEVKIVTD